MADYHVALGSLAAATNLASVVPYYRDVIKGSTKPHLFTWLIWGIINVIAFFAQSVEGGGAGTWITAATALGCLLIAALALTHGERHIAMIDWWCLGAALGSIVFWVLTSDPLVAILFVILAELLAYVPTFRKAYSKPHEETALTYVLGTIGFGFGLIALETFNVTTALYQFCIIATNSVFVTMLLLRRKSLAAEGKTG